MANNLSVCTLDDLRTLFPEVFTAPDLRIASRWLGVYVKHPTDAYFLARPSTSITGVGGAGMTLSFGLAEKIVKENLGED